MEWPNPRPYQHLNYQQTRGPTQPWYYDDEDDEDASELERTNTSQQLDRFLGREAPPAIPPLKVEPSRSSSNVVLQSLSSLSMPQLEESTEFQPFFSSSSARFSNSAYLSEHQPLQQQQQQQSEQLPPHYSQQFTPFPSAMTAYYSPLATNLAPPAQTSLLTPTRPSMDYNSEGAGIPTFHNTHYPVPTLPSSFGSLQPLPQTILEDRGEDFNDGIARETPLSVATTDTTLSLQASALSMTNYADHQSPIFNTPPEYQTRALPGRDKLTLGAPFTEMATSLEPKFSPDKRKLCCVEGCTSQARAFNRCKRHGGSKRCSSPGCTKSVQSRGLCIRHGGGSRCQEAGCGRASQSHGKCKMHGGGRPCIVAGCEKKAHLKRLCRKHGGGAKCAINGCDKWAQRQGMCMTHAKMVTIQASGDSLLYEQKSSSPPSAAGSSPPHSLQFFNENVPV